MCEGKIPWTGEAEDRLLCIEDEWRGDQMKQDSVTYTFKSMALERMNYKVVVEVWLCFRFFIFLFFGQTDSKT